MGFKSRKARCSRCEGTGSLAGDALRDAIEEVDSSLLNILETGEVVIDCPVCDGSGILRVQKVKTG